MYVVNESQKSIRSKGKVVLDVQDDALRSVDQKTSLTMMLKREKLVQITKMKKNGHSISEIARKTQTTWITVKRYLAQGITSPGRSTRINYNGYTAEFNTCIVWKSIHLPCIDP